MIIEMVVVVVVVARTIVGGAEIACPGTEQAGVETGVAHARIANVVYRAATLTEARTCDRRHS